MQLIMMRIINCTEADIPFMLEQYDLAREYQQQRSNRYWQGFDRALIQREIEEKRQWKIVIDGTIACIFMIAYEDPNIWKEKSADPAIYIHRIVTHPEHHGKGLTKNIIAWAKEHAKQNGKKYLRMDTWGDNPKLNDYYSQCGFTLLEIVTPENTEDLPPHYSCISLSLFEMEVEENDHGL